MDKYTGLWHLSPKEKHKIHYITSSGYPNSTHANQYGYVCQYGHGTIEAFPSRCICWEGLDSGSYWILSQINN